jgi:predicted transcriptional regulator
MIDKYNKHIVPFMMRSYRNNVVGDIVDAENDALEYILKESDFREKDIVEAQVIIKKLCDENLLKMIGKWNEPHQFILTREGVDLINK